jgi:alkaline phosphatase D
MQDDRRRLLVQAAALAGAALTPAAWTSAAAQTRLADNPFTLGVASGEPLPDGVVLWTRLATRPLELGSGMGSGPVVVRWEIAEDEGLSRTVDTGQVIAAPEAGHSVHVEVGGLKPGRDYWYRFTAAGYESPKGRTRTTPDFGSKADRLRIAFSSCQKYEAGYYAAHAGLAAEHPDLVLFLGDYIYEKAASPHPSLEVIRAHPSVEAADLASYRLRYAWYKSDPNLQAAHAAAPWLVTWDDHEVSNDYGGDADRSNPPRAAFLKRRAAAYQAYYENMPLRRTAKPVGPDMSLYRTLDWGNLAQLALIDDRQYRAHRTCDELSEEKLFPASCPARTDPARTMLGRRQEAWLQDRFGKTKARWNLLGQQTLMGEIRRADGRVSNDGWDGYVQTRDRILQGWRDAKVANPIALGGDVHCFFAGDLGLEPGKPIGTEFVGGSISSLGRANSVLAESVRLNPHLKFADGEVRGYGLADLTPNTCKVTFRGVQNARVPVSPMRDLAKFVVEAGEPGVKRA